MLLQDSQFEISRERPLIKIGLDFFLFFYSHEFFVETGLMLNFNLLFTYSVVSFSIDVISGDVLNYKESKSQPIIFEDFI